MKRSFSILIVSIMALSSAEAVTIGPAQTKKERERMDPSRSVSSPRGYEAVLESFLNEDFTQSERLASRFLERKELDARSEEILYIRALSLMKLNRFSEARPLLKELESEATSTELRSQAAYSLGDSFYFENKRAEADIYYKEAVRKYPGHGEAGQVKRLLGLSHPPRQTSAPLQQLGVEEAAALQYSVQVGAFARRRNAERLLNKLLRNRYDAYIDQQSASGHFRVRVGHLAERTDAQSLETRLKKDGYPTKIFP